MMSNHVLIAEIAFKDLAMIVGFVVSTLGFVVVLFKWLEERTERRREKAARKTLEAELQSIKRRGRAPFLRAVFLHVPKLNEHSPNKILHPSECVVPSEVPAGTTLELQVANDGEPVRNLNDDWTAPEGFWIEPGGLRSDDHQATNLSYRYEPKAHGQPRRITITFETMDGLQLHQVYETKIGLCELRRIDPE